MPFMKGVDENEVHQVTDDRRLADASLGDTPSPQIMFRPSSKTFLPVCLTHKGGEFAYEIAVDGYYFSFWFGVCAIDGLCRSDKREI